MWEAKPKLWPDAANEFKSLIQPCPSDKNWHSGSCYKTSLLWSRNTWDFFAILRWILHCCLWNMSLNVNSYIVQRASSGCFEAMVSSMGRKCCVGWNRIWDWGHLDFISELSWFVLKLLAPPICSGKKELRVLRFTSFIFRQLGNSPIKCRRDFIIPVS